MYSEQEACSSQPMTSSNKLIGSQTRPVSQAESQLLFLNEQVKSLSAIISDLEGRLNPVLRSQDPQNDATTPEPVLTPLAGEIRKIGNSISYKAETLKNIIDRLEI